MTNDSITRAIALRALREAQAGGGGGLTEETDPLYTKDKPNIALKSDIPLKSYVVQNEEPTDKNKIWIDTDDNSEGGSNGEKWELIEKGQTGDTRTEFKRTAEPDGTPYNFKGIKLKVWNEGPIPDGDSGTGYTYLGAYYDDGYKDFFFQYWAPGHDKVLQINCFQDGNFWRPYALYAKTFDSFLDRYTENRANEPFVPFKAQLQVHTYLGWPPHTNYEIWAIRA